MRRPTSICGRLLPLGLFTSLGLGASPVHAVITGFGDGSNYTLSGYDTDDFGNISNSNDPPSISNGTLTLTTSAGNEARAAYYNTPQTIGSFVTSFVFQDNLAGEAPAGEADGFTFVIQNQGLTAIGGNSSGLGYDLYGVSQPSSGPPITAIVPSAALEFYLRNGTGATDFGVNGSGSFDDATPTDPVDLADGDPILITLTYDDAAETLTEKFTDETTAQTSTLTRSADITGVVGTTGYVGFTGGTGGGYSTQTISDFTFSSVPEPASLWGLTLGAVGLLRRRRHPTRYSEPSAC